MNDTFRSRKLIAWAILCLAIAASIIILAGCCTSRPNCDCCLSTLYDYNNAVTRANHYQRLWLSELEANDSTIELRARARVQRWKREGLK